MSERVTEVRLPSHRGVGLIMHGLIEPEAIIAEMREMYRAQLADAQAALAATDAELIVETHRGVYKRREVQQLWPLPSEAS